MPFDSISELWKDYLARFYTFAAANSIPEDKMAQVFLTNQTTANYKLLATLAGQQTPPRRINDLEMKDITTFMETQYDPKQFVVRERFKFWSGSPRKPGEKVTELAARIRQDASTCDFPAIKDIQDEAMHTRFICAVKNEAVLKAVFKLRDDELTFSKAVDVAQEMEEAAKVAKETVHGSSETPSTASVYKMSDKKKPPSSGFKLCTKQSGQYTFLLPKGVCFRCGKTNHLNLIGISGIATLDIDVRRLIQNQTVGLTKEEIKTVGRETPDVRLRQACHKLCKQFTELFQPDLGCLKDVELEVKFKSEAKPIFCKPRTVPFALLEDLNQAYDEGIKKRIWVPTTFNEYGTPVVPVRKALQPNEKRNKLQVCGDYSVTVNPQLDTHRQPLPFPDDLVRKLSGGYYFTKIELANAYNQIRLAPESQKRLALSNQPRGSTANTVTIWNQFSPWLFPRNHGKDNL